MGLKKRNKFNAEFNMSSLTDIIFLLLIFFMLTSNVQSPNAKEMERPVSGSKTPSPQNVFLSLLGDGTYYVNQDETTKANLEQKLALEISKERKKNRKKGIEEEVTVVLNVEMDETTGTIVEFMKLSNKLGVRLILATDSPKEEL